MGGWPEKVGMVSKDEIPGSLGFPKLPKPSIQGASDSAVSRDVAASTMIRLLTTQGAIQGASDSQRLR